jgi:hypothetical protein
MEVPDWIQLAQDMVQWWHSSEPVDSIQGWKILWWSAFQEGFSFVE